MIRTVRLSLLAAAAVSGVSLSARAQPVAPPQIIVPSAPMFSINFDRGRQDIPKEQLPMLRAAVDAATKQAGAAIVLCYRFGADRAADYQMMDNRIKNVGAALKEQRVLLVFKGSHVLCQTTSNMSAQRASVQIHRVSSID